MYAVLLLDIQASVVLNPNRVMNMPSLKLRISLNV